MWPRMRRTCMLACCVAAALGVFAGTASAGGGLTQTYADPVGDSGTGADIGNTTVTHLDGALTFRIEVPNRPAWVSGEEVGLFFNTDGNQLNGDAGGRVHGLVLPVRYGPVLCVWSLQRKHPGVRLRHELKRERFVRQRRASR